jgi:ATP-binding cassette subfamily B protein
VLALSLTRELPERVWKLTQDFIPFSEALGECKQALSLIQTPHEIVDTPEATSLKVSTGSIAFNNVAFNYSEQKALFKNISVAIPGGQRVGLVGFSGSGKSTFVNLILRLFDVQGGSITIDDQDIRMVTQDSLRKNISYIPQEPLLFHRSVQENILYGRPDATYNEMIEAAQKAHAHDFILSLEKGYDTIVGERGIKLSGGQRQRIVIARAFLKNAPILILDEATSALDSETEKCVQASLEQLVENRTVIVVAHRLSTLLFMNRILIFDAGEIVEDGTHQELLGRGGRYARLWNAQISGFLPDDGRRDDE